MPTRDEFNQLLERVSQLEEKQQEFSNLDFESLIESVPASMIVPAVRLKSEKITLRDLEAEEDVIDPIDDEEEQEITVPGEVKSLTPHIELSSTETQKIQSVGVAQAITYDNQNDVYKIGHSLGDSKAYIQSAGVYSITISAIADLTTGTNQTLNIWLAVNGANIENTNTIVKVLSTAEQILSVTLLPHLNSGDYFELFMSGSATTVQLLATPAQINPIRPVCPSIITSVYKISEIHN